MDIFLHACLFTLQTDNPSDAKKAKVDKNVKTIEKLLESFATIDPSRRESLETEKNDTVPDVSSNYRSTLGTHLKFVNREKSINELLKHVKGQYDIYRDPGPTPEKSVRLAACSGGPGLGKTTFCRKAFTKAADESGGDENALWKGVDVDMKFQEVVKECVYKGRQFRISFGSSAPLGSELKPEHYANSLALRLLMAKTKERLSVDCGDLPEDSQMLKDVVGAITGRDSSALIVLNLDETNAVMEEEKGSAYLKGILSHIRQINTMDIGFVFVILSGTNVRRLHDLMVQTSAVAPVEIPLPLLTDSHVEEILQNLVRCTASMQPGGLGEELKFAVQVLGGVPRYVEMLAFCLGNNGDDKFTHSTFKASLVSIPEPNAKSLLEQVKAMLIAQYGTTISSTLSQLPIQQLMCMSLFKWSVQRETEVGDYSLGELEYRGIVFFEHISNPNGESTYTIQLPLLLTLLCFRSIQAQAEPDAEIPMLLNHFDVTLSSDENERNSLAMLALKCLGLQKTYQKIELKLLLPLKLNPNLDESWKGETLEFTSFELAEAKSQVKEENWDVAFDSFKKKGAFVKNCRFASFGGDMMIVPKNGKFVLIIQEKQGEKAKTKRSQNTTVPTCTYDNVRKEHDKCKISTRHLFVFVTDEAFTEYDQLLSNEIVLSHSDHIAAMGSLLALLRKFNHSNIRKTAIA
jgi:hypothetical protein